MTRGTMEGLCRVVQATRRVPQRHSFGRPPIPLQKQVLAFVWFISNSEVFWPWSAAIFVQTRGSRGRPGRLKDRERHGTGDKDEKSVNGTQIFHREVSTGKTGLPFQEFRLFGKIFSGTNQNVVFHLHPNGNFRNFLVNGKRSNFQIPNTCSSRDKSRFLLYMMSRHTRAIFRTRKQFQNNTRLQITISLFYVAA